MKNFKWYLVPLAGAIIVLAAFFWSTSDNNYPAAVSPEIVRPGYETTPSMVSVYPSPNHNYKSHGKARVVIMFVLLAGTFWWAWYTGGDRHLSKKPVDPMDKPTKGQRTTLGIIGFVVGWLACGWCIYGLVHAPKGINYITDVEITKVKWDAIKDNKDSISALFNTIKTQ